MSVASRPPKSASASETFRKRKSLSVGLRASTPAGELSMTAPLLTTHSRRGRSSAREEGNDDVGDKEGERAENGKRMRDHSWPRLTPSGDGSTS